MTGLPKVRRGLGLAALAIVSAVSVADARPDARTMTCSQLQALLNPRAPPP